MFKVILLIFVLVVASIIFIRPRPAAPLTSQDAVTKVKNLPAVKKYLTEVPSGRVDQNGGEENFYLIQVYEIKNGHTATFNWYQVNKKTGATKAEFEMGE